MGKTVFGTWQNFSIWPHKNVWSAFQCICMALSVNAEARALCCFSPATSRQCRGAFSMSAAVGRTSSECQRGCRTVSQSGLRKMVIPRRKVKSYSILRLFASVLETKPMLTSNYTNNEILVM